MDDTKKNLIQRAKEDGETIKISGMPIPSLFSPAKTDEPDIFDDNWLMALVELRLPSNRWAELGLVYRMVAHKVATGQSGDLTEEEEKEIKEKTEFSW